MKPDFPDFLKLQEKYGLQEDEDNMMADEDPEEVLYIEPGQFE